jgi:hypothetical protein
MLKNNDLQIVKREPRFQTFAVAIINMRKVYSYNVTV